VGWAVYGSSTEVFAYVPQTGGTYPTLVAVDQFTPFSWNTGYLLAFAGVYETTS
jgi:hypothetical protein